MPWAPGEPSRACPTTSRRRPTPPGNRCRRRRRTPDPAAHTSHVPAPPPCHLSVLQLLQQVLGYCSPRELGALEATCSYFIKTGLTDRVAKHFLKEIPRAKGLKPDIRWARMRGLGRCCTVAGQQGCQGPPPRLLRRRPPIQHTRPLTCCSPTAPPAARASRTSRCSTL